MKKGHDDICPICKGSGKFQLPKKIEVDTVEIKRKLAKELWSKGYSIRQIQKALGYKSPRSIHIFVNE